MTGMSRAGRRNRPTIGAQAGFTYLGVLAVIVIMGIMGQAAVTLQSHRKRVDQEAELAFRGQAYVAAIHSYYEAGDPVMHYPRNLDDLLYDRRFLHKRHIRRLYDDPIVGGDWVLVRAADGGIAGVVSSSAARPIQRANFPKGLEAFEGAGSYADWMFEYVPPANDG